MKLIKCLTILFLCLNFSTAFATEKLTIMLDWFVNPDHAPLVIAQEKGFFKEQNLEVKLIGPADPSDPPKLVAAGKVDMALTYQPQFIEQIDQGLPLKAVGMLINKPLNCLAVLKNSPIQSIAHLKNKKIGYTDSGIANIALKKMLEQQHLSLNDVELINVHYGLSQALLSKQVDAITGIMRTFEVIQMQLAGQEVKTFLPEQLGVPNYSELIYIVNEKSAHDVRLIKFMIAIDKATAYLQKHPTESWKLFTKNHPELNNELNRRAFFATLTYFAPEATQFNLQEWQAFVQFMYQNKGIKKIKPVEEYLFQPVPLCGA